MKILDVGCGREYHRHLESEKVTHLDIDKEAYHLEVVAEACFLPFQANSFDAVHISHVLEHIENPLDALAELKRVSREWVIISVPNAVYGRITCDDPEHLYSWNQATLRNLLETQFKDVKISAYPTIKSKEKRSNLRTLKRLLLSLFLKHDTLTAICSS